MLASNMAGYLGVNRMIRGAFADLFLKHPWLSDPSKRESYLAWSLGKIWDLAGVEQRVEYAVRDGVGALAVSPMLQLGEAAVLTTVDAAYVLGVDQDMLNEALDRTYMRRLDRTRKIYGEPQAPGQRGRLLHNGQASGLVDAVVREAVSNIYGTHTEEGWNGVVRTLYDKTLGEAQRMVGMTDVSLEQAYGVTDAMDPERAAEGLLRASGSDKAASAADRAAATLKRLDTARKQRLDEAQKGYAESLKAARSHDEAKTKAAELQ